VHFLSLLWRGCFASTDGPNWFISNNYFAPVLDVIFEIFNAKSLLKTIKN
jgi:hypothetical protein